MSNLFVISSNCKNGPKEFLEDGEAGMLFESNSSGELRKKLIEFCDLSDKEKKIKKLKAKKNCLKYTMFRHNSYLRKII